MQSSALPPCCRGVFPVGPTIFTGDGHPDLDRQPCCVDFVIVAGSNGLRVLANFSEQFSLSDKERNMMMCCVLEHVASRVPVIVATSHFGTLVCAQRSRRAQDAGAATGMEMPPYQGPTFRASEAAIVEFFRTASDAIEIPVTIQDALASGTYLRAALLARMAVEIPNLSYIKIEVPQAAAKLRELSAFDGDIAVGSWDGEEAITLMADLEAGAMTGGGYPDGIRQTFNAWTADDADEAGCQYRCWLPLVNHENRLGGSATTKAEMKQGGRDRVRRRASSARAGAFRRALKFAADRTFARSTRALPGPLNFAFFTPRFDKDVVCRFLELP